MSSQDKVYLIITADDFGYCPERNRGIIECFKSGAITGTSLMVNAVACKDAVKLAKEHNVPLGLHMNLTEGSPLNKTGGKSTLLDDDGYFLDRYAIQEALRNQKIDFEEVRNEMRSQISLYRQHLGHIPVYADGHQYVHVFPGICQIFGEILQEYNITATRLPIQYNIDQCSWVAEARQAIFKDVQTYAEKAKTIFQAHGIRYPHGFIGLSTMGNTMTVERIESALVSSIQNSKQSPLTFELVSHPGHPSVNGYGGCGQGPDEFSCSQDRAHEMSVLRDERLKAVFEKHNVQLCSYREMFRKDSSVEI